ncbi:MAG: hypothetical protein ACRDM7_09120 [Thermoleophilaceae bacterium]
MAALGERCISTPFFAWTPYLHGELGEALEQEELRLIEEGAINGTGFVYVGERSSG